MVAIRSSAVARLSLVVFIAACRRRRQTARLLLPLCTPAPIHRDPGGEKLKLADPQIDARFEDSRIERRAAAYAAGGATSPSLARPRGRQNGPEGSSAKGLPSSAQLIAVASSRRAWRYLRTEDEWMQLIRLFSTIKAEFVVLTLVR